MSGIFASLASSFLTNAFNAGQTNSANDANRKASREQMRFQERMSSTAYQRSMADMKKAGLNPILAYTQGGASTPQGASATSSAFQASNPYDDALGMENTKAHTKKTKGEGNLQSLQAQNLIAQSESTDANTALTKVKTELAQKDLIGKDNTQDFDKSFLGKAKPYADFAQKHVSTALTAATALFFARHPLGRLLRAMGIIKPLRAMRSMRAAPKTVYPRAQQDKPKNDLINLDSFKSTINRTK